MYFDPRTTFDKYKMLVNPKLVSMNHVFSPCNYYEYDDFLDTLSSVYEHDIV